MVKSASQANITSTPQIFDRAISVQRYKRTQKNFSQYDFLHQWAENDLLARLSTIKREFKDTLLIGSKTSPNFRDMLIKQAGIEKLATLDLADFRGYKHAHTQDFIKADAQLLPIKPKSQDMIISCLNLHNIDDLPGALAQMRMALKPDGLLIANLFGGETLFELRASLTQAESIVYNGISPHIAPFADKPQMGDLLSRAGLALPVVDSDIIKVTYPHIFKLMHDLRGMGENNILSQRRKNFTRRALFMEAQQHYVQNHAAPPETTKEDPQNLSLRLEASFEIIALIGWAPAPTQQQPLKPGSAQNRLADALGAKEKNL